VRSILMFVALTGPLVSQALAHTGVGQVNSFAFGITHPLGTDYILAMVAVGLWAVLSGGRAIGRVALRAMGGFAVLSGLALMVC
jgi:urease accessory protein